MALAKNHGHAEERALTPWLAAGDVAVMQGAGSRCGGTVECRIPGSQLEVISGVHEAKEPVVGAVVTRRRLEIGFNDCLSKVQETRSNNNATGQAKAPPN